MPRYQCLIKHAPFDAQEAVFTFDDGHHPEFRYEVPCGCSTCSRLEIGDFATEAAVVKGGVQFTLPSGHVEFVSTAWLLDRNTGLRRLDD